jgi:hypothetical protein
MKTVRDYPSMLSKLWTFALVEGAFVAWLCWLRIPAVHAALGSAPITFGGVQLPWLIVAVALAYATFVNMIKLHDRISDVFRIRHNFDVYRILLPLAVGTGVRLPTSKITEVSRQRQHLMRRAFYRYASSTKAEIDQHDVTMALNQWGWYWICLEGAVAGAIGTIALAVASQFEAALLLFAGPVALLCIARLFYESCSGHALSEVDAILDDDARRAAVVKEFGAL